MSPDNETVNLVSQDVSRKLPSRLKTVFLKYWSRLLAVALALFAVALLGYFTIPSPHAEGALRGRTVEIHRNGWMQVMFSQPMDKAGVESAFHVTPEVKGSFSWQLNQLTFKPAADLEKGATYEVTVNDTARSFLGKRLSETFRQRFLVLDYPEVVSVVPTDKSEVGPTRSITVLFDHPIRVLTNSVAVPADLFKIEPAVKGQYHWLGTSGVEFVPDPGWPDASDIKVTVPKDLRLADGSTLAKDFSWTFHTRNLWVGYNGNYDHFKLEDPFRLNFNYPVAAQAVAAGLRIESTARPLASSSQWTVMSNDQFTFKVDAKNPLSVTVQKKTKLELGKFYRVTLPLGWTGGVGSRGLQWEFSMTMITDEVGFRLLSTYPDNGGTRDWDNSTVLKFNNNVDGDQIKRYLKIEPLPEDLSVGSGPDASVSGKWQPSTPYKITLSGKLADIYGQPLGGDHVLSFMTGPYKPAAEVSSYSSQGLLAAYLPRLYQVRTMNMTRAINATVCSGSFEAWLNNTAFECAIRGVKGFDPTGKLNHYHVTDLDLDQIAGFKLPNGIYDLDIELPELPYDWQRKQTREVVITDTALTLKQGADNKILVWATDMKTGEPVSNLTVEAYGRKDYKQPVHMLASGQTDKDGLWVSAVDGDATVVRAFDSQHLGLVDRNWNDGISVWNYGLNSQWRSWAGQISYVYTDRAIYRPDQLVYFKGVVRDDRDAKLSLPDIKEIEVVIRDANGQEIQRHKYGVSSYGTFWGQLQLASSMPLGTYTIEAQGNSGYFDVREYRRPDFKVEVQPPAETLFNGQEVKLKVHAAYYQGASMPKAKVDYTVTRRALYFQPMAGEWYSYTLEGNGECYWYCSNEGNFENVASGSGTLDDNGDYILTVPANLTDYKSSASYAVTVTVTDLNQRSVSNNSEFTVHKGDVYVGIRPNYDKGWSSATADFDVVTVDTQGNKKPNWPVAVKLYYREYSSVKKEANGETIWDWQSKDTLVDAKSLTTDDQAKGTVSFMPKKDGLYVAVAETRDSQNRLVQASTSRYVYRGNASTIPVSDDHLMKIIQDKAEYKPGDTASLSVQTPYEHTKALVTVERGSISEYRVIDLGATNREVKVNVTDASVPNFYVSVLAAKGGGDKDVPDFRLGYASLQVNTGKKVLNLDVTPDKQVYHPRDEVTLDVTAKDYQGKPVAAEVSVAVVDERVVALLGSIDKNILGRFWFTRGIGVGTAQSLTKLVKKVFFAIEGDGAGGGGKGEGAAPAVRSNLLDTAYWKADVVTGADGQAKVSFKLPDNLTTWQILAIGATKDTVVGSVEKQIMTRRDLMVEPALPRILRHDDTSVLGATVFNATDQRLETQVSLDVVGVELKSPKTQKISLAPQSRQVVNWNVHVPMNASGKAKVTVTAKSGNLADGLESELPILSYSVPETVTASDFLERGATQNVEIPDGILTNAGGLTLSVAPTVAGSLTKGVNYLLDYEYGCAEQTTSAMVAGLVYHELAKTGLIKQDDALLAKADAKVNDAIKKLASQQRSDGDWGFWADSDRGYAFITAYVYEGLSQAKAAGFEVDQKVMDKAESRLREELSWSSNCQSSYLCLYDEEKARVLYAISEHNPQGLAGYAATLFEQRSGLSREAKAYLAMAYVNLDISSNRPAILLAEIKNGATYLDPTRLYIDEGGDYGYYFGSTLGATSLYVRALLKADPRNLDIDRAVRYLVNERHGGYWYDTHDTAGALFALTEFAKDRPLDKNLAQVTVYLDSAVRGTLNFPQGDASPEQTLSVPMSEFAKGTSTHELGLEKDNAQRYAYDFNLQVYREISDIAPYENGFTVVSDYYAMDDKKNEHPLAQINQGDIVRVRMKLLVPKRSQYVAWEHHLPAGLEAIDMTLLTSPQNIAGSTENCAPDWWGDSYCMTEDDYGWWWGSVWKHIEQRDDRVFLFSEALGPGAYDYEFLARAVTPGTFRVPPARAYEFYNPKANGHNEGKIFTVTPVK